MKDDKLYIQPAKGPQIENLEKIKARLVTKPGSGEFRIEVQRAKFKHWHELGKHDETDRFFWRAYSLGAILWARDVRYEDEIFGKSADFSKKVKKNLQIKNKSLNLQS